MPSNTLGNCFTLSSFGESHGQCIGAIIDGCPAGLRLSEADVQPLLDLRKPGQSIITTQRRETDTVEISDGTDETPTTPTTDSTTTTETPATTTTDAQ